MLPPGSEIYRDMSDGELEMNIENIPMTDSCDVVRYVPCPIYHNFPSLPYCISGKSSFLIDNGEMKVGEFQKEIHVSSSAYSNFLRKSGAHQGEESDVYYAAWRFFKKREMKGIKTKQKLPTKEDKKKAEKVMPDVSRITLDGEEDDRVEVYDTCDEIRRKINAVLKKPGVTQAALLRAFAASFHKGEAKKISASQLSAFRSKKGPYAGNQSSVFYGAYVYFEKVRLAQKKPKSKKRLEMEEYHGPRGGVVTDHQMERFICRADERICVDSLGRFHQYGRELE